MEYSEFLVSFDWDGTLTSGDGPVGQDDGAVIDLTPLTALMQVGPCAISTCNVPSYVASVLEAHGVPAYADEASAHKVPDPLFAGRVLVTNRKVLASHYVDDRNITWRYGGGITVLLALVAESESRMFLAVRDR